MMDSFLSTIYDEKKNKFNFSQNKADKTGETEFYSISTNLVESLKAELPGECLHFIANNIDLRNYPNILLATKNKAYIENLDFDNLKVIINTKKLNILKNINRHLSAVNTLLPDAGLYIGRAETYGERKIKIYKRFGKRLGRLLWLADFFINRVPPKIKGLKKIYYYVTKGKFHAISLAETLGRIVYNGFEIIDYKNIEGYTYFIALKTKEPSTHPNPTYHPLVKLQRIGKNGKLVGIYKMRTMFPYSEYLQDFIVKMHGYNEYGKPANDFRLTRWGKLFRKFWIDEIPQFINLLKGDIGFVGVRPLSKARFRELPEHVQKERIKYRPGLIPPYVSLNMPDSKGNIVAEEIYLKAKKEHPKTTNMRYFFMAVYNILTRKIESS